VSISSSDLSKIVRFGRYSKEKQRDRSILITFKETDTKVKILRGGSKLKEHEDLKNIRLAYDLTCAERDDEKTLYLNAKT
jgi:hypothetical protein